MRLRKSYVILTEKVRIEEIITEALEGVRQFMILKLRGLARAMSPKYNARGNKKTRENIREVRTVPNSDIRKVIIKCHT